LVEKFNILAGPFQVVMIRNVFIYFQPKTIEDILSQVQSLMSSQSYLILGHCESLFGFKTSFETLGQSIYVCAPPAEGALLNSSKR
jgi:chemotaxis protein methyltransferase CheR